MSLVAAFALSADALPATDCRVLTAAKQAGELVEATDTTVVPCPTAVKTKAQDISLLRFDRKAGVMRARSALLVGQALERAYFPPEPAVRSGDQIAFSVSLGHVKIARKAVALQTVFSDQSFFARTDDGAIIAVPPVGPKGRP